jgi:DNA-binding transcriptional ArsR family regulator
MTYAKTDAFDLRLQQVAALAKLLSHPARLAILQYLAERKSCFSGNIAEELPLSRTTVSQHLQELKRAGLIDGTVEGLHVCYCIDEGAWKQAQAAILAFFEQTDAQLAGSGGEGECC